MQYSVAAVLALAATVSASYNQTIVYTTEVVDTYVTVCPASATITYQGQTITNTMTESATITLTCAGGCTVSKPIYTTSSVHCESCAVPTSPAAPVYPNSTVPTTAPGGGAVGTTYTPVTPPTTVPVSGATKLSGASLAGVLALAAYFL